MPTAAINQDAVLIGNTDTLVGQVPAVTEWNIAVIRFANTDSVDHNITIGITGGASLDAQHTEYQLHTVQANTTFEYGPVILATGWKIFAVADVAGKITSRIHGWAVT